jgi:hypothetical protein
VEPLTPQQLDELRAMFPMLKFFIFGYPRSGTTLLMRLVSLHPKVHCSREAHFFTQDDDATRLFADQDIRQWLERRSNRWTTGQNLEPALVRLVIDFIMEREARRIGKTVVGDKSPNSNGSQAVRKLHALYPEMSLIYIVRDGRDAALSHRFQHFIDQPQYLSKVDLRIRRDFAQDSQFNFTGQRSVFTRRALIEEATSWASNVTETHCLGQELYGERYTCLRYEDLLVKPEECMQRLWAFLQVDATFPNWQEQVRSMMQYNPGAEAHQRKEEELTRHLRRGQQGGWQNLFTERDRRMFKEIAGSALVYWGYEKSLDW